jgi:hypothetical protein
MHRIGTLLLRKVGGTFGACRASRSPIAGSPARAVAAPAFLSSVAALVLVILAVAAFVAAALHAPAIAHLAAAAKVGGLAFLGNTAVVEKREELRVKQAELAEVMKMAEDGNSFNLGRKNVLEKLGASDDSDALVKIKNRNIELGNLAAELRVAELKAVKLDMDGRTLEANQPSTSREFLHPSGGETKKRTLGDLFISSDVYAKEWKQFKRRDVVAELDIGMKQIFSEGTPGFPPQSIRTGLLVEGATRPIQVLDLIPTRPINQALDKYMAETTRTHASAEKAEGVAFAESTFVWAEQTQTIQKITDSIPVTDEQLADAEQIAALLNQRIAFGLRQRLDYQVINGNGTSPNLTSFTDTTHNTGIQTQAKGSDPTLDATYKALTLVRFTGRANPSAYIFNPNDWQNIRLLRTTTGEYLFGNPSQAGATTLWGLPVALADSLSAGTIITGDFQNFCYIGERQGVEMQIGYVNDDFIKGKQTIRGDLRCCLSITRQAAFCLITGV